MPFADLIVRAGHLADLESAADDGGLGSCVAVGAGRVLATGGDEILQAWRGPRTELHEFDGVVLPGLVDAHAHPVWGSLARGSGVTLNGARTLLEVRELLAE